MRLYYRRDQLLNSNGQDGGGFDAADIHCTCVAVG